MKNKIIILLSIIFLAFIIIYLTNSNNSQYEDNNINGAAIAYQNEIILKNNDILEIKDKNYIIDKNIKLYGNSKLIIKNSVLTHKKEYGNQYSLNAYDRSQIIIDNSTIQTTCNGVLNWNFYDSSSLIANNMKEGNCNIWNYFTDSSSALIINSKFKYGGLTSCKNSNIRIEDSENIEMELCTPENSILIEELPLKVKEFKFPNQDDSNINTKIVIINSTISGWGIGVPPKSIVRIKNSPKVTISIIIGFPLRQETVILEDLSKKDYKNKVWNIANSKLELINTEVYGWEPNVFGDNTLIVKNSNFTGSTINSGSSKEIIENSIVNSIRAEENVEITLKNSEVLQDVIAVDNSKINLINTKVKGRIIEKDNGKVKIS